MKSFSKILILAACLLLLSVQGFSQRGRLGFFINGALSFPVKENFDDGYGSGIGTSFSITRNLSVSLEWKYGRYPVNKEEGKLINGTLYITPVLASLKYDLLRGSSFSPYAFLGGGLIFSSFTIRPGDDISDANITEQKIKNGFGLYGGLGAALRISNQLSLFAEGLYLHRKTDAETKYILGLSPDEFRLNLSSYCILIGIKYTSY